MGAGTVKVVSQKGGRVCGSHLEVNPTIDQVVRNAEVVALAEGGRAPGARETGHMVDIVACPHHQVVGVDTLSAACTPFHGEQPFTIE